MNSTDTSALGLEQQLLLRQVSELYRLLPASIGFSYVGAAAVFAMLVATGDASRGLFWFALATAIFVFRGAAIWGYAHSEPHARSAHNWARLVIVGNLAAGIQWGLLGTWLFTTDPISRAGLTLLVLPAYVTGAAMTFSAVRYAHAALAVPATVPPIINVFLLSPMASPLAAGLSFFFVGAVIYLADQQHRAIRRRLIVDIENERLLAHISEQNAALGQHVDRLSHVSEVVKRSRAEARRRADTLSAHIANTPVPVFECDQQSRIVEWNDAAMRILGYPFSEASNMSADAIVSCRDIDWAEIVSRIRKSPAPQLCECELKCRDGTILKSRLAMTPISPDVSGQAQRLAIIALDLATAK